MFGNLLTVIAGYFFGSSWIINLRIFLAVLFGSSLIMAGAEVINNILDRKIDKKMQRTNRRALVVGDISIKKALYFGVILALLGFYILSYTNYKVEIMGLIGFVDYVAFYSFMKRRSIYGTLVGSIAGSVPVVAGYLAFSDKFNLIFLNLFLIMVVWQMAHFYAIAIYRRQDYANAKLPLLPLVKGLLQTKIQISFYVGLYLILNISLYLIAKTGIVYPIVMSLLSLVWIVKVLKGFNIDNATAWAKDVFKFSLIIMVAFSIMLSIARIV